MALQETCMQCGKVLGRDDVGAHKKLINRGADRYLCIACLAAYFHVEEALVRQKIEEFKKMGCTLFV